MPRSSFFPLALSLLVSACGRNPPTDEEMIARFKDIRPQLTELRDMAIEDHKQEPDITMLELEDLKADWANNPPKYPLSDLSKLRQQRRERYVSLFTELKIEQLQVYKETVDILAARKGIVVAGWKKSFVWDKALAPDEKVLPSLDYPLAAEGYVSSSWFKAYRRIEDGWYLEYSAN